MTKKSNKRKTRKRPKSAIIKKRMKLNDDYGDGGHHHKNLHYNDYENNDNNMRDESISTIYHFSSNENDDDNNNENNLPIPSTSSIRAPPRNASEFMKIFYLVALNKEYMLNSSFRQFQNIIPFKMLLKKDIEVISLQFNDLFKNIYKWVDLIYQNQYPNVASSGSAPNPIHSTNDKGNALIEFSTYIDNFKNRLEMQVKMCQSKEHIERECEKLPEEECSSPCAKTKKSFFFGVGGGGKRACKSKIN
jgi:hypothetical protein